VSAYRSEGTTGEGECRAEEKARAGSVGGAVAVRVYREIGVSFDCRRAVLFPLASFLECRRKNVELETDSINVSGCHPGIPRVSPKLSEAKAEGFARNIRDLPSFLEACYVWSLNLNLSKSKSKDQTLQSTKRQIDPG
jgi:hypothetical protein